MKRKIKILGAIVLIICAVTIVSAVSSAPTSEDTDDAYHLQINTTGKWRLDLTVNGNYTSDEDVGSKTIDLNTTDIDSLSVTVNQYENGPTDVFLLKGNETIHEEHSKGSGIETIYFYYPDPEDRK